MTPATDPPPATLTIEAGRTELHYWRDLWHYRELLGFLAWRDVKVRYKQAVLGAGWALIQPVITTIIFTVIFGRLAGMPDGGIPYPCSSSPACSPGSCSRPPCPAPAAASCPMPASFPKSISPASSCRSPRSAWRSLIS